MKSRSFLFSLLPFWLFALFFKFGAGLHYALLSTLGTRVLPVWIVGLIIGGATLLEALLDVPAGFALDRFGYRRLLMFATGVSIIGALTLISGLSVTTFLITLLLVTFGWLMFNPGTNAYVLSQVPQQIAGRAIGLLHAAGALGIVLSSVMLAEIISWEPSRIGAIIVVILLVALCAIFYTKPEQRDAIDEKKGSATTLFYSKKVFT